MSLRLRDTGAVRGQLFAVINVVCIVFRDAIFDAKNKNQERITEEAV